MGWFTSRKRAEAVMPEGTPDNWKDVASAAFNLLDKEGAGYITTVPSNAPVIGGQCHSEISVLGDEVLEAQKRAGDMPMMLAASLDDWLSMLTILASQQDSFLTVGEFLAAIQVAATNGVGKKSEVDEQARDCFSALSDMMAGGPQAEDHEVEAFDVTGAIEELCNADPSVVKVWCMSLLSGLCLPPGAPLSSDEWAAHCELRSEEIGWPRVTKMLLTLTHRAERARAKDPERQEHFDPEP